MTNQSRKRGQISELTHIAPIKQGYVFPPYAGVKPIRYADRLRTVLEAFNNREDLGAPGVIRLFRGIHNVKWALLDGDTRLMVNVVFDGDLHFYLRALARNTSGLLSVVWSNCEGWKDPHDDSKLLIDFIERHQVRANFFYAQYPELTVPDVEGLLRLRNAFDALPADSAARRALEGELYRRSAPRSNAERLAEELKAFGDTERSKQALWGLFSPLYTQPEIEVAHAQTFGGGPVDRIKPELDPAERLEQIQANVLTDYPERHAARSLFVHFQDPAEARSWLAAVRRRLTFGRTSALGPCLNLGFTFEGLRTLGVDAAMLSDFPDAFKEGMDARADRLGDPVAPPPSAARRSWTVYHGEARPIHAVLFVYAPVPEGELRAELVAAGEAAQAGARDDVVARRQYTAGDRAGSTERLERALAAVLDTAQRELDLGSPTAASPGLEYLGHQDLHRPLVECAREPSGAYGVEYFGFRDGVSQPRLPGLDPRAGWLPAGTEWLRDRPSFDAVLRAETSGLLKNASFLVMRQLRQDPDAFWHSMRERAATVGLSARALAEQIMGRRLNGRRLDSVAEHFDRTRDLDAFDVDNQTPSCPFHSHVRRANPRTETDLSSNPRLMRRSLAFVNEREHGHARGLMFMAFNAEIETQFELIQRHWLQSGNQVGLGARDRDVLVGLEVPAKPYAESTARFFAALDEHGAPNANPRELRFEHAFVSLEWGLYLYFPAQLAMEQL